MGVPAIAAMKAAESYLCLGRLSERGAVASRRHGFVELIGHLEGVRRQVGILT